MPRRKLKRPRRHPDKSTHRCDPQAEPADDSFPAICSTVTETPEVHQDSKCAPEPLLRQPHLLEPTPAQSRKPIAPNFPLRSTLPARPDQDRGSIHGTRQDNAESSSSTPAWGEKDNANQTSGGLKPRDPSADAND